MDGSTSLDTSTSRDEGEQTESQNHIVRKVYRTNARSRNVEAGSSTQQLPSGEKSAADLTQHDKQRNNKDANLSPIRHDGADSPEVKYKLSSQISSQSIQNGF